LGWLASGQPFGSPVGLIIGSLLADLTGSYCAPCSWCAGIACAGLALVWAVVTENFIPMASIGKKRSLFSGIGLLTGSVGPSALFMVLLMAQLSSRTIQDLRADLDRIAAANSPTSRARILHNRLGGSCVFPISG
jgi:hypothetical protein